MLKKTFTNLLRCTLIVCLLVASFSFPSLAATKTQTRSKAGPGCVIEATMTFSVNSSGIVSNGKCTKVNKASGYWMCVYNNHSKTPYRYNSNKRYDVHTSGLWADPGEKGSIVNVDVTGFY